jgi:putative phosphoribosyl transferase
LKPLEVHNRSIFANRQEAGRELAAMLGDLAGDADVVVLGLPRGGVPVAREVADALGAPLDVFVVRKLGAPSQPELALGAIASGGVVVLNDEIVRHLGIGAAQLQPIIDAQRAEVEARDHLYRGDRPPLALGGRTAVLVDDGLATGATMRAAVAAVRQQGAASVIVAVPVAAVEAVELVRHEADRVVVVATPRDFVAVGLWYRDFLQVSDGEVRRLLA